jgi:hypothetical protein
MKTKFPALLIRKKTSLYTADGVNQIEFRDVKMGNFFSTPIEGHHQIGTSGVSFEVCN